MRLVLLVLGFALGVAATLAYSMFVASPAAPAAHPAVVDAPVTVTLGETFLTGIIQRAALDAPGVAMPRTQLRVELRDDTIVVHAAVDVLGKQTEGTAVLRPALRDGHLQMAVVQANLGTIAIPAIEEVLEQQVNARLDALLAGMPGTITGVTIARDRGMIVTAQVDLDRLTHARRAP